MRTVKPRSISPDYVTGVIEVAGTFTYSRSRGQLSLYFALRLGAEDIAVLRAVRRFFGGGGRIYTVRPAKGSKRACYYRVTRLGELRRIVSHFDRHALRGSKRRSYEIWKEMVVLKVASFGDPPRGRLDSLARKLSATSRVRSA
jgi:hypothetical protein